MNDRKSPSRWKWTLGVFAACAVLWFAGFPWITRAEEGTAADVQWLVSTIVAAIGVVALVVGTRAYLLQRRAAHVT